MKQSKVIRSAGIIGCFTFASRMLGLVRDVLMAGFFGTSVWMSAFVVAFTIPNLFRRLFGEGALSAAFVPVFVETRQKDGDDAAWDMAYKVVTLLALVLAGIVVVGVLLSSLSLHFATLSEKTSLILLLLRIMFPYMLFICLAALSMAILNSFHHFAVPAATPCLLNILWIGAILFICPHMADSPASRIGAIAWAVMLAGVLQLTMQLPALVHFGYRFKFSCNWRDERISRMLTLMGPAALGLAVTQFNVLIDRLLATWIGDWAPAALFYSERMIYFPIGIFATALGTVLLPTFSKHSAQNDQVGLKRTLNHSLRNLLFVMIPASAGMLLLAFPIVQTVFQWGVFSLAKVFVPAFYAQQDTRTPVIVGIITVGLNLVLNLCFVLTWPLYLKHAGLACATVLAEAFYAVTLAVLLHRRIGSPGWKQIGIAAGRSVAATGLMVAVIVPLQPVLTGYLTSWDLPVKFIQIGSLAGTIIAGMTAYLLASVLLKSRECREIFSSILRR